MNVRWRILAAVVALCWVPSVGAQTLQEQAMCATEAASVYQKDKADAMMGAGLVGYEDHYNPKLNRCFMIEHVLSSTSGNVGLTTTLMDAFEGHILATYTSVNGKLFDCELTPTYQSKTVCKSAAEFNAFVQQYMGAVFGGAE